MKSGALGSIPIYGVNVAGVQLEIVDDNFLAGWFNRIGRTTTYFPNATDYTFRVNSQFQEFNLLSFKMNLNGDIVWGTFNDRDGFDQKYSICECF